jgi:hypothetical protein
LTFIAILIVLAVVAFRQLDSLRQTFETADGGKRIQDLPAHVEDEIDATMERRMRALREATEGQ